MNQTIFIDSLIGKEEFLRFWKLPVSTTNVHDAAASIITRERLGDAPDHAMVMLGQAAAPELYKLGDSMYIFCRVRRATSFPSHLEEIAAIKDTEGRTISHILKDSRRHIIYLPFYIDDVIRGFQTESYIAGRKTIIPPTLSNIYYWLKPGLPSIIKATARQTLAKAQAQKKFPKWPIETSLEQFKRYILELLLSVSQAESLPFIWFWPQGKQACLTLTHDVETGLSGNSGIWRLIEAERAVGLRSSFNVVPFKYPIDLEVMDKMRARGCELGVHGFSHDAKLFSSWPVFRDRVTRINRIARDWGAVGFRSAATYRNPHWLNAMEFEYDSSFFDTDPYEPQPGGCVSLLPYFHGDMVEVPITMPQDHTLFTILREREPTTWLRKAAAIAEWNGLICMLTHPDPGYAGDPDKIGPYKDFLRTAAARSDTWNALPREIAHWWRRRDRAEVTVGEGRPTIAGGGDFSVARAGLLDGRLVFK